MIKSNPIPTWWRTIKQRSSPLVRKVQNPTSGFPAWGHNKGPVNLTLKASGIWLQDFHKTWRNRDSSLTGHRQNLVHTKAQRKGAVTPQETEPKLLVYYCWRVSVEAWVGRGSPQGWEDWQQQFGKVSFDVNPPRGFTTAPQNQRAGSPQTKKLPGRKHNPTHLQITGLKLYWARPCPPEQDPVFPITTPFHQEAYTGLLHILGHSVVFNSLLPHGLCRPWNSPGQNTGVGNVSLLKKIFPTQGSNPRLPHCRWILYCLSHQGSPRILEWVAYTFSRGSSWPRNQTGVSYIARGFFTTLATRETHTNLLASSIRCQTEAKETQSHSD